MQIKILYFKYYNMNFKVIRKTLKKYIVFKLLFSKSQIKFSYIKNVYFFLIKLKGLKIYTEVQKSIIFPLVIPHRSIDYIKYISNIKNYLKMVKIANLIHCLEVTYNFVPI